MKENHITVSKKARYFTSGNYNDKTQNVWIVCHGYGQLANYFLKKFDCLNNEQTFIIAPEGFHRFYTNGFNGRVGASWMTKEDRLNDIDDYVNFLNLLYDDIIKRFSVNSITINVLGFSQGAATVCRWIQRGYAKIDNLILWAAVFPPDVTFEIFNTEIISKKQYIVCGDKDEFISTEDIEKQKKLLDENGIEYKLLTFNGKHEINTETLVELDNMINN